MKFVKFLLHSAGENARKIIIVTAAAGILQGLTLYIISCALDELAKDGVSLRLLLLFLLVLYCYYRCFRYAMLSAARAAQQAVSAMELRVTDTLRSLGLLTYERLDQGMVYQAVVGDKAVIVEAGRSLVTAGSSLVMMVLAFFYAAVLSMPGFLAVVATLAVCGLVLSIVQHNVLADQEVINQRQEAFTRSLKDLLRGFAELKMSRKKSEDLFESQIKTRAEEANQARLGLEATISQAMAFFTSFIFIPVGVVLFVLPGLVDVPFEDVVKLIGVVLFIVMPLMSAVMLLPLMSKAHMTLASVESFESLLRRGHEPEPAEPAAGSPRFQSLRVSDLVFAYKDEAPSDRFKVEVEEFRLDRGEMVFITGGNGSGKTTFMKVVAGLYPPDNGEVLLNGQPKEDLGLDAYRGVFSLILSDFHLFERLYGVDQVDPDRVRELLAQMRLEHKVSWDEEKGFSTQDLSSGQRRRLALVAGLLEDRDVLLLDEVAADFDPVFRRYFYLEFLPLLHEQGRTVLAVSHDDRYYHVADRVLRMRSGRIEPEELVRS